MKKPKRPVRASKPIISFRLPVDLIDTLTQKSVKQHVSRNKLTELILRHHFDKGDQHVAKLVEAEVLRDNAAIDLFT